MIGLWIWPDLIFVVDFPSHSPLDEMYVCVFLVYLYTVRLWATDTDGKIHIDTILNIYRNSTLDKNGKSIRFLLCITYSKSRKTRILCSTASSSSCASVSSFFLDWFLGKRRKIIEKKTTASEWNTHRQGLTTIMNSI